MGSVAISNENVCRIGAAFSPHELGILETVFEVKGDLRSQSRTTFSARARSIWARRQVLPRAQTMQQENRVESSTTGAGPECSTRRSRILVVDDSSTIRLSLAQMLAKDFDCLALASATEALEAAVVSPPDIIISDVQMDGMDGHEFCRRVRETPILQDVPFILMTTSGSSEGRAIGLEEGADDYLLKPVKLRELLARVRSLVRLREARAEIVRQNQELTRAHQELLGAQRQLVDAEKMATVGVIASGVAHEINNPLTTVRSGFGLLCDLIDDLTRAASPELHKSMSLLAEVPDVKSEVFQAMDRITSIIRKLTLFAADEGKNMKSTPVEPEIQRALVMAGARLQGVSVKTQFESQTAIRIAEGYLSNIISELLYNAADAIQKAPEPRIHIETKDVKAGVEISVVDNGPGIAPELMPRIFDPFFTTKPASKGVGLGLSTCRALMDRLGGHLVVNSRIGEGTQVRLFVPALTQTASQQFNQTRHGVSTGR
jgi:signal transduction histidine kinase